VNNYYVHSSDKVSQKNKCSEVFVDFVGLYAGISSAIVVFNFTHQRNYFTCI